MRGGARLGPKPPARNRQPRSRSKRRQPRRRARMGAASFSSMLSAKAVGLSVPFCGRAQGACIPDGMNAGCCPIQCRGHIPLTTGTGGLYLFTPSFPYPVVGPATLAGSTYTFPVSSQQVSNFVNIATNMDEYRVVSWGVLIRVTSSATASQGLITLNEVDSTYCSTALGGTWLQGTMQNATTRVFPVVAGATYYFIGRPEGATANVFGEPTSTAVTSPNGFSGVVVELSGLSSGNTTLDAEVVINIEARYSKTSPMSMVVTPTPEPNPLLARLRAKLGNALDRIGDTAVGALEDKAMRLVSRHIGPRPMALLEMP